MATLSNTSFFSPTQISGCALWLDAADSNSVVLSGNNVTQWRDKSGNGRNATPSNSPTYSGSNISLANSSYFNGSLNIASGTLLTTAFCVAVTPTTVSGIMRLLSANDGVGDDFNSPSGFSYSALTNGLGYAYRNLGNLTTASIPNNTRFMTTTIYFSNGNFIFSFNGNYPNGATSNYATTTNSSNTNTLTKYYIGTASFITQFWNGSVNEFIIFNRTLSQTEYQQIEGYLAWKWGLQQSLPTGHPFYNYNPNIPNINLLTPTTVITTPLQVSGCALWLDAADSASVLRSGSNVTQWNDKSGNSNNATGSNNPIYVASNNSISFTGTQFFTTTLTSLLSNQSAFAIVSFNATSVMNILSLSRLVDPTLPSGIQQTINNNRQVVTTFGGTTVASGVILPQNTTLMYGYTFSAASNSFLYYNATQTDTRNGPFSFSGSGTINIGAYQNSTNPNGAEQFRGNMFEIILYSNIVSTTQRQQIEGYLAWKWGLQQSLPTGHPYYNFNPSAPLLIQQPTLPLVQTATTLVVTDPRQISGCALWLDAADSNTIVTSGGFVTQWLDKSGNGRNTTALSNTSTYNSNVLNGLNGIVVTSNLPPTFITDNNFVLSATSQITAFIIINQQYYASSTAYIDFMSAYPTRNNFMMGTDGGNANYPYNTYINNVNNYFSFNYLLNTPRIAELVYDGTTPALNSFINGSRIGGTGTPSPGTSLTTSQKLSVFRGISANLMSGQIFEVLFYSRNISVSERQQIEGYLAWKWGLQSNLPVNHPYYFNPLIPNLVLQSQLLSLTPYFFDPRVISGCALWLDAADSSSVITTGLNVTQWNDKSGNLRHMSNATLSNTPTYNTNGFNNLPTISFNPNIFNFLQNTNFNYNSVPSLTLFIITQRISNTITFQRFFSSADSIGGRDQNTSSSFNINTDNTNNNVLFERAGVFTTKTAFNSLNPSMVELIINGSSTSIGPFLANNNYIYLNGSLGTSSTGSGNGNNFNIVHARLGNATYNTTLSAVEQFQGNISEVIIFNRTLALNEFRQIEGYLAWKWGLQSNLPSSHPFILFPPG